MHFAVMTASLEETGKAIIDYPAILTKANESLDLLCKTPGQAPGLSLCVWERNVHGHREIIVVNNSAIQNEGQASAEGISSNIAGFEAGKCSVNIRALKITHFGPWSCTLVTQSGLTFTATVRVIDGNYK